jgi:hypothetical protein
MTKPEEKEGVGRTPEITEAGPCCVGHSGLRADRLASESVEM